MAKGPEKKLAGPAPETRRVTIRDVASAAQVSLGTVSRVLNKHPRVGADARIAVEKAIKDLGYVPDAVAQSMRFKSSRAIGCMVSNVANPLFSSIVSSAEMVANAAGYNMILANSGDDPRRESEILSLFQRRRLDGAIMTLSRDTGPEALELLSNVSIPIVMLERQVELEEIDSVASDHYRGLKQALDYLRSLNHSRIGLITVPPTSFPGRERLAAYTDHYRSLGLEPDPSMIANTGFTSEYARIAAEKMFSRSDTPTAIVAGANQIPGVLHAARSHDIEIPGRLSLISIGDSDLAQLYAPPLTVVRWQPELVGQLAIETLLDRITAPSKEHQGQHFVQPTELVVRQSCSPLS